MDFKHEPNRIYSLDGSGNTVCEITFPEIDANTVDINRTFVDDSLKGQGIAGLLMEKAVEDIRRSGKKTKTSCSYAEHWFEKHPENSDILA